MQTRSIILAASAAAVLGALIVLFFKVQASPAADVPVEALEQARQRHQRAQRARPAPRNPVLASPGLAAERKPVRVKKSDRAERPKTPARLPRAPIDRLDRVAGDRRIRPRIGKEVRSGGPEEDSSGGDKELQAGMSEANRLYDRADYDGARTKAQELLKEHPDNVRMLRVVVSSSCMMGDEKTAQAHYERLPERDQRHMRRRCSRYGVEFADDK